MFAVFKGSALVLFYIWNSSTVIYPLGEYTYLFLTTWDIWVFVCRARFSSNDYCILKLSIDNSNVVKFLRSQMRLELPMTVPPSSCLVFQQNPVEEHCWNTWFWSNKISCMSSAEEYHSGRYFITVLVNHFRNWLQQTICLWASLSRARSRDKATKTQFDAPQHLF